jgi:hypothetical protein
MQQGASLIRVSAILTTALCAAVVVACSGNSKFTASADSASSLPVKPDSAAADNASREVHNVREGYAAWLANPGEPGADYDPARLTITYLPEAQLPTGIEAGQPVAGQRAAEQPGAVLRVDRRYEVLTDAIAAKYGLKIDKQVYWGLVRVASFVLPEKVDGDIVLTQIRQDFAGCVDTAGYSQLYRRDGVYIPDDPDYKNSSTTSYSPLWSLHRVGASQAWGYSRGDPNVLIAVLDTGIRITHEELAAQVIDPQDLDFGDVPGEIPHYVDLANDDNTMEDFDGHGTFIAGQVAAEGDNQRTIVGLAHKCRVIPIKITNADSASDINIIYGSALAFYLGARVISLSFGDYHTNGAMEDIVNQLWNNEAIFVASAGNDGVTTPHYPADYPNSISVGATDIDDARVGFSNYSEFVDIAAPGVAIKSCQPASDTAYNDQWWLSGGTSFASPLVAAAAALLWSYDSTLTNNEIRDLLEDNADPTTGFTEGDVGRLDIAAALAEVTPIRLEIPHLSRLVYSDTVPLTVEVTGTPDRVDCYFNGNPVGSRENPPWTFSVDTSALEYGLGSVMFVGVLGQLEASAQLSILVDNSAGAFPVTESFEGTTRDFEPLELKDYSQGLLNAVKSLPDSDWTLNDIRNGGPATWNDVSGGAWDGYTLKRFGAGEGYSGFEIDALVSRRLDLTTVAQPTLVFYHHYNIEDGGSAYDRGRVLVSDDNGLTFTLAERRNGEDALYSGYVAGWQREEVDLSPFYGSQVHVALVFESDQFQAGEQGGEDAGWWVDQLTVAMDYIDEIPSIGAVTVQPNSAYGSVPDLAQLTAGVQDPDNVARVRFTLDLAPFGSVDLYDVSVTDDTLPFQSVLDVPTDVSNQLAHLQVYYYDPSEVPGPVKTIPVYVFNQLGDTNADGLVDDDDLAGYPTMVGLTAEDEGYIPLYDSNVDGTVTEHDAAAVGYNYGAGQ